MEARVFVFPTSALKIENKKINYFHYISSLENEDCNQALLRMYPIIHMEKIIQIIEDIPFISDIRKDFYKEILRLRYEKIIKYSYEKWHQKNKKK